VYSFGAPNRHLLMIDAEDAQTAAQRFVEGFGAAPPFEVVVVLAEGSSSATRYDVRKLRRHYRSRSGEDLVTDRQREERTQRLEITAEAKRHAETLGLDGWATAEEVHHRYRELVAMYHPDKVIHLGPKLRAAAEEEMRAINEAVAYFRDHGGF
jgi:hypothetical protein